MYRVPINHCGITVALLGMLFVAGAGATATTAQQSVPTDRPTQNVTQRLTMDLYSGSTTATIEVNVIYPARTKAEAAAARNGTLDPEWFQGSERLQQIFNQTADDESQLLNGSLSVSHEPTLAGLSPPSPAHGWISLEVSTGWENYIKSGENMTISQAYANALEPGWKLVVAIPTEWNSSTVNGDPRVRPAGHTGTEYQWTVKNGLPDPLLVAQKPPHTTTGEGDSVLGSIGGTLLTLVGALTIAAALRHRRD